MLLVLVGGCAVVPAAAQAATGQISGQITQAGTVNPVDGGSADVYDSNDNFVEQFVVTNQGNYTAFGLAPGSYRVEFISQGYAARFYNGDTMGGSPTGGGATLVTVSAGSTTPNIDGALPLGAGQISGQVTDAATHAGVGAYVTVYDSSGFVYYSQGFSGGPYTIPPVLGSGSYRVGFSGLPHTNYVPQFYNDRSSLASADSVSVTAGSTHSGINAALVSGGGQLTGTVTDAASHHGMEGVTVDVYDSGGNVVGSATTAADGTYAVSGLASGQDRVGFTPSGGSYSPQFYDDKSSLASADPVAVSAGSTASGINAALASPDVTISAPNNPIPEPASGSVPATFTITLPSAQSTATTINYQTVDGTAKAINNDYTAVPNPSDTGSVTIPAGDTSAPVQVDVDDGSGKSTTETKGFQVQLLPSAGPAISTTDGSAPATITVPGIGGTLTDRGGTGQSGVPVTLTGTATSGQSVMQTVSTSSGGRYQFYVDPGSYAVKPKPPATGAGNPAYEAVACPGSAQVGECSQIRLGAGEDLSANFKMFSLIVNSTDSARDPAQSLALGICDTTPSDAQQSTCTLPAAIDVANKLGGGGASIGFDIQPGQGNRFDGSVPQIELNGVDYDLAHSAPMATVPLTIDGTTEPGGRVEISKSPGPGSLPAGLTLGGPNSVVRGLAFNGFDYDLVLTGSGDIVQKDSFGTDPLGRPDGWPPEIGLLLNSSTADVIGGGSAGLGNLFFGGSAGIGLDVRGSAHDLIEGNVLRAPSSGDALRLVNGIDNTVGGRSPGEGNLVAGTAATNDAGDVVQGNHFLNGGVLQVDGADTTIGGATRSPGTGAGNDFDPGSGGTFGAIQVQGGEGSVVQGDRIRGRGRDGVALVDNATHVTVGGARADLGNLIEGNGPSADSAGVLIQGGPDGDPPTDDVVAHNQILDTRGTGGVVIQDATGNRITANEMSGNEQLGIDLGGGGFRYDRLESPLLTTPGPNHYQPYPLIDSVRRVSGGVALVGQLQAHRRTSYDIELYSEKSCADDSITPGQGHIPLGSKTVHTNGLGEAQFDLRVPDRVRGERALTATASSSSGDTSEFSPCLTIGHLARRFTHSGVTLSGAQVDVQAQPSSAKAPLVRAREAAATRRPVRLVATAHPFCPPVTTRYCAGTVVVRQASGHKFVARLRFKLAPGQLGAFRFRLPSALAKVLEHRRLVKLIVTISAHDGAHPVRHKSVTKKAALRLRS